MAIDTKLKRASVQGYQPGFMFPPPDGSVDDPDRAMCANMYAGFTYGPLPPPVLINVAQEIVRDIVQKIASDATDSRRDKSGG